MGKFARSTASGAPSTLDEGSVQLPVAPTPEAEAAAPASGGLLDQVLGAEAAPEPALPEGPVALPEGLMPEEDTRLGQEIKDAVPSIKERQQAQDTGRYDFAGTDLAREQEKANKARARLANSTFQPDGGLNLRAQNFETAVHDKSLPGLGGLGAAATGVVKTSFEKAGLVDPAGTWTPQSGMLMSVVTENFISDRAHGDDFAEGEIETEAAATPTQAFSKAQGRALLGQQIAAEKARMDGREAPNLSKEEAEALGDVAQELYFENNQQHEGDQFMIRTEVGEGTNKQVAFQLTQKGSDLMTLGAAKRKRLFPKQHVRTQKAPLGGPSRSARAYTKQVSSKAGVKQVRSDIQKEALQNLNKVANVVDPGRNKILLTLAMGALSGNQQFSNDVMFLSDKDQQGTTYDLAQDVYGIQVEKDGANYLTYYTMDFNGRMAPQQTTLDPTTSKAARFVTRNAIPADSSNSRIKRNLKQMYAMHLVPDKYSPEVKKTGKKVPVDQLMPAERARVMDRADVQAELEGWGLQIINALAKIPDATINQISEGIKNKTPAAELPQLPALELSQDLVDYINSKGEDGMMALDGLVDYYNFRQAEKAGRPHMSYFNATMDGKTNGIASNGIQMGSENVARKTGVITSAHNNTQILDNGMDIRDDLQDVLNGLIDQGFDGKFSEHEIATVRGIASRIADNRQFNKDITMTFGYGKEIDSFKRDIEAMVQEDPESQGLDVEKVSDEIFQNYIPAMEQVMDEDALNARAVMRSSTWIAAWYNELFEMDAPLEGQKLSLGATSPTGYLGKSGTAKVWTGTGYRDVGISQYGQEATSAAEKTYAAKEEDGEVQKVAGDVAYGGSIPGPVQSLDAATVVKTVTGSSWKKLSDRSQGHPYIHTIYDAFKTDANGFDTVLEETNKNWLDLNMDWSYLESMAAATKAVREKGKAKYADRADSDVLSDNEALMLRQWIQTDDKGNLQNLANRFKNLMQNPDQAVAAAEFVKKEMVKVGYRANAQPTVGQLKAAIAAIERVLEVDNRLNGFINRTNKKKDELKKTIKSLAPKFSETLGYDLRSGAQYYAH